MKRYYMQTGMIVLCLLLLISPVSAEPFADRDESVQGELPPEFIVITPQNLPEKREWLIAHDIPVESLVHDFQNLEVVLLGLTQGREQVFYLQISDAPSDANPDLTPEAQEKKKKELQDAYEKEELLQLEQVNYQTIGETAYLYYLFTDNSGESTTWQMEYVTLQNGFVYVFGLQYQSQPSKTEMQDVLETIIETTVFTEPISKPWLVRHVREVSGSVIVVGLFIVGIVLWKEKSNKRSSEIL